MIRCFIGFGSNLTVLTMTSAQMVLSAICKLDGKNVRVIKRSQLYSSIAVPYDKQPSFVNSAVKVETSLSAEDLLSRLHEIEQHFNRERKDRWSARTMDIDLLSYGDNILPNKRVWSELESASDPAATLWNQPLVPHIRMHRRAFVLKPLLDVAPDWRHPVFGKSVDELYRELNLSDREGVSRI